MFNVIVAGHAELATGLVSALTLIAGERDNVAVVEYHNGQSPEDLDERIQAAAATLKHDGPLLILTDLHGGTPFNRAGMYALKHDNVEVFTGVNLPMLIQAATTKKTTPASVLKVMDAASKGVSRPLAQAKEA